MTAVDLLRQARAQLLHERDAINGNIVRLDAMIVDLDPPNLPRVQAAPLTTVPLTPDDGQPGEPTVRDAVVSILDAASEPMRLSDLIERASSLGVRAQDDSIRGIVSKMMQRGEVQRVAYGLYAARGKNFPTNEAGPVVAEPAVVHDPVKGGEWGDAAQPERRRDHDQVPGRYDDHGGTAPALVGGR